MALFVRKLNELEQQELEQLILQAEDDLPVKRLNIVALSAEGVRVPKISEEVGLHPINVRKWIHRFNDYGFDGLRSAKSPGRPPVFNLNQRERILTIATTNPRTLGLNFTEWSLKRLRSYLIEQGVVQHISVETVRQIIQSYGITHLTRQEQ